MTGRVGAVVAAVALLAAGGDAQAWSPPVTVPGSRDFGYPFDVAVRPDRPVAVAFTRGERIRVAVRRPGGRWSPLRMLSTSRRDATGAEIAFDGRGRLVVAWVEEQHRGHGPYLVRTATRSRAGRWSAPETLGRAGHFRGAVPRVAANHRGDAVVVWRGVRPIRGSRFGAEAIQAAYRRAGRAAFGRTETLAGAERQIVTYQQVALGEDGRAYAAWTNATRQVNRLSVRRRGRWTDPVTVSGRPSSIPVLALTPGGLVVAWHRAAADSEGDGTQFGPLAARRRLPSGALSATQAISSLPIHEPSVAVSPAGEVMLAYADETERSLHFAVAASGAPFGAEQVAAGILAGAPSYSPTARLAYVADGTALLVLRDGGIRATERAPGGTFSAPVPLSPTGDFPMLAAAANTAAAVWVDGFEAEGAQRLVLSLTRQSGEVNGNG